MPYSLQSYINQSLDGADRRTMEKGKIPDFLNDNWSDFQVTRPSHETQGQKDKNLWVSSVLIHCNSKLFEPHYLIKAT